MAHTYGSIQPAGPTGRSTQMENCIRDCQDCATTCIDTVSHCLQKGGPHTEPGHIRLLTDCIEICHLAAKFMQRGSDLHAETCRACAVICERCEKSCREFGDDPVMVACADACRQCAESCRKMAGAAK